MKLRELKKKGALVPETLVPREVTWVRTGEDGQELSDTFTIFVKRQSYGAVERMLAARSANPDHSVTAQFISDSVFLGDSGEDPISYEDAYALDRSLGVVLMEAVRLVNDPKRDGPKN